MSQSLFDFLQELDPELVEIGRSIEKIFYDDPHGVLVKGRLFGERMTKKIAELEKLAHLNRYTQVERVNLLDREGIFTKEISQALDTIRTIGNRASHERIENDLELAIKIHKNLFKIAVWFREVYGDYEFTIPTYRSPVIMKNTEIDSEKISELIESKLESMLQNQRKEKVNNPVEDTTLNIEEPEPASEPEADIVHSEETMEVKDEVKYKGKKLHESYLLYELSKLKESSQEAVEGSEAFSSFKKYLHVDRPIQNDLLETLKKVESNDTSELIFLCGSVGDGKSHLLAYMNETHPDLMKEFKVHNDATESFDPQKNSLDTLAEVLNSFSDENIRNSKEKLILAINLGVLHNFLESNYAKEKYTKLKTFIYKSKVFETNYLSENYFDTHFNLISFSDYHPYQLTKDGPKSAYFDNLLEKIVQPDEINPFYLAFIHDERNNLNNAFMQNYRLLQKKVVREKVSHLLIEAIVQHKYIISTRTLLNFIHDIIVPANIEEYLVSTSVIEDTQVLLPNLLFNSIERSPLLKVMSQLDPINSRSEKIDEMLILLNNTNNIINLYKQYLELDGLDTWVEQLKDLGAFYELTKSTRHTLNATLIRMGYFLGKGIGDVFINPTFNRFMSYLYAYNRGIPAGLREIYQEMEDAVFTWKGQPRPNSSYIYQVESLDTMNIAQSLDLKRYVAHLIKRENEEFDRFKNTIVIGFQDSDKRDQALLEIDYPLYKTLLKVLKGYRPNKKDKEDAIQFIEFIEKLIQIGKRQNELVIHETAEDIMFKLEYDEDFEEFSFKREQL